MNKSDWKNSVFLKILADIIELKDSEGFDLQVHGSGELIQLLLKNDLVDELWLKIHPLTLGIGKKLFDYGNHSGSIYITRELCHGLATRKADVPSFGACGRVSLAAYGIQLYFSSCTRTDNSNDAGELTKLVAISIKRKGEELSFFVSLHVNN